MDKGWGTVGVYRAIEPQACISTFPCCMISLLQNLFLLEKVILLFPLFFPFMYSLCLPIVPHSCSVHMVLCLHWDQTLNYKSYIFSNYFIHLCMWLSSQLKPNSDWDLSLLLIERYKEAASDWLSEMSPSYQELVSVLPNFANKAVEVWRIWDATEQPDGTCQGRRWWGALLVWCDFQQVPSVLNGGVCIMHWFPLELKTETTNQNVSQELISSSVWGSLAIILKRFILELLVPKSQ